MRNKEEEIKNYENVLHFDALESKILGCIDYDNSTISDIKKFLRPEMFSDPKKREVYELMLSIIDDGRVSNILSITQLARTNGSKLTPYEITQFTKEWGSSLDAKTYAQAVAELWIKRSVGAIASKAVALSDRPEQDAFDLLEMIQKESEAIAEGTDVRQTTSSFKDAVSDAIEYMDLASEGMASGVPSDLTELDELTSGFQNGDLIIIAARPAMGKSALVTTIQKNSAHAGYSSAMFSLEMSKFQVVCRLVAEDVQLPVSALVKRTLDKQQREHFKESINNIAHLPITIDDDASMSITQMKAKARDLHRKGKLQLLIVDYMQLMSGDGTEGSREQEIAKISRELKKLAKELNIPVIALSQLSRAVEQRDNKRPMMSDLRESGSIEQDADMIMFLYRPEYYAKLAGDECPPEFVGKAQLIIGKYRNGSSDDIYLDFLGDYSTFKDRSDLNTKLY